MSDDSARIEISASSSQLDAGLRDAAAKVARWSLGVSSAVSRGMSGASKAASPVLTGAAHRVGASAVDFIADQARGVKEFEADLTRLGIAGDLSRQKIDAIRTAAFGASSAFGIAKDQLIKGTQAYVDITGDIEGASASMETFGKVSAASGTAVDDVAKASAALRGAGVDLKDMPNVFSGLIAQGKKGAVTLKNLASELPGLLPLWGLFRDGSSAAGISEMGAALQLSKLNFNTASEAANGLQALIGEIMQKAPKLKGVGIDVYEIRNGEKHLKSFEQIMTAIENSKLVKNDALKKSMLGGSKEGYLALEAILKGRKGIEGQESAYRSLIAAGGDYRVLQQDLNAWLTSAPGKAEQSWERLKNKIGEVFTPDRIEKFGNALEWAVNKAEGLVNALGKIPDFWDDSMVEFANPFEGRSSWDPLDITGRIMGTSDITNEKADSYRAKIRDIKGRDGRADKIREAVQATITPGEGHGQEGVRAAGWAYLEKMKPRPEELAKANQEVLAVAVQTNQSISAMVQLLGGLGGKLDALASRPITMDTDKVHAATGKSTNPRTTR